MNIRSIAMAAVLGAASFASTAQVPVVTCSDPAAGICKLDIKKDASGHWVVDPADLVLPPADTKDFNLYWYLPAPNYFAKGQGITLKAGSPISGYAAKLENCTGSGVNVRCERVRVSLKNKNAFCREYKIVFQESADSAPVVIDPMIANEFLPIIKGSKQRSQKTAHTPGKC